MWHIYNIRSFNTECLLTYSSQLSHMSITTRSKYSMDYIYNPSNFYNIIHITIALLFILVSLMFTCDLWMAYSEPLLDWLVLFQSSATLVNSCRIPFISFQSASISFIWFLQLLGVISLALLLLIFWSYLSYLCPVQVGDRFARPPVVTIRPLNRIGPSRRLVPLSGMAFLSNCALFHTIFLARL